MSLDGLSELCSLVNPSKWSGWGNRFPRKTSLRRISSILKLNVKSFCMWESTSEGGSVSTHPAQEGRSTFKAWSWITGKNVTLGQGGLFRINSLLVTFNIVIVELMTLITQGKSLFPESHHGAVHSAGNGGQVEWETGSGPRRAVNRRKGGGPVGMHTPTASEVAAS